MYTICIQVLLHTHYIPYGIIMEWKYSYSSSQLELGPGMINLLVDGSPYQVARLFHLAHEIYIALQSADEDVHLQ